MTLKRLENRVALVTGAGTGIGAATAHRFAREGAHVVLVGRRAAPIEAVVDSIRREVGTVAIAVTGDVSDTEQAEMIIRRTFEEFGALHVAFNNAGILGGSAPIGEILPDTFDQVVAVNLRGAWLMIRAELTAMVNAGLKGSIISTSSSTSRAPVAGTTDYAASKGGLDAMTPALAMEAGPHGIRVNTINPGAIETEMFELSGGEAIRDAVVAHTPLRRLGRPEDIADAALWLASEESSFVTGQNLLVDGGFALPGMR